MQTPENSNAGFFASGGRSIWGMIVNTMIPSNLMYGSAKQNRNSREKQHLLLDPKKNNDDTLALIIQIKQNDSSKEEEPIAFLLTAEEKN